MRIVMSIPIYDKRKFKNVLLYSVITVSALKFYVRLGFRRISKGYNEKEIRKHVQDDKVLEYLRVHEQTMDGKPCPLLIYLNNDTDYERRKAKWEEYKKENK